MFADLECYYCSMKKAEKILIQYQVSQAETISLMKQVFSTLASASMEESAPMLMAKTMEVLESKIDIREAYQTQKEVYNSILLAKEQEILSEIEKEPDELYAALQYALLGNYIDFGALDTVDKEILQELFTKRKDQKIGQKEYFSLRQDLEKAKKLVYMTDNAGEIVLDKILIQTIQKIYPAIEITVLVRGEPILNDATLEDADKIGLTKIVKVLPNGTKIPGTQLSLLSEEAKKAFVCADIGIAKGQGNFETLWGCGYPLYYLFLCKCNQFVQRFQVKQLEGFLKKEFLSIQK